MRSLVALLVIAVAAPALAQSPGPDDRSAWAQTDRGVRILGGSGSVIRFDQNTSASLSPRVGRFVADGLALSASVQLGYSRSFQETLGTISSTQLGVGPTVTYYVGRGSAAVRPFVEADLSLTYARTSSDLSSALGVSTGFDFALGGGLGAGIEVPIARNVALRGEAFYRTSDLTFDGDISFYGLSAGFSTFIY